jgi:hypothetical protein
MKHVIEVLSIKQRPDKRFCRSFSAKVDGVEVSGNIKLMFPKYSNDNEDEIRRAHYRLLLPKNKEMTGHSDYQQIRRELILAMIDTLGPGEMLRPETIFK